jgi:hypothetical protein
LLEDSAGDTLTTGYNMWGYNYQARSFNGTYCDSYRDAAWCQPSKDVDLQEKWNDTWLDNKDCDGDGLLDRHFPLPSYVGSGAWLTNHQSGSYEYLDKKGRTKLAHWNYFVKIVAVPLNAYVDDGIYDEFDGTEIGPEIWGEFAIIQEVLSDPVAGDHGLLYHSPRNSGLGSFGPQH